MPTRLFLLFLLFLLFFLFFLSFCFSVVTVVRVAADTWPRPLELHATWLRHNCPSYVDPSTGQLRIDPALLAGLSRVASADVIFFFFIPRVRFRSSVCLFTPTDCGGHVAGDMGGRSRQQLQPSLAG